jgi:anti-repressor protein
MSQEILQFVYDGKAVRTVPIDGEPWWVLTDVCKVLGLGNSHMTADKLDADEKAAVNITDTSSKGTTQGRKVTVVSESGLYAVILLSRKPEAKQFKRWITHEVIPAIRKHGAYMSAETIEKTLTNPDFIMKLAQQLKDEQQARQAAEAKVTEMKPKARFFDTVMNVQDCVTMREAAKLINKKGLGQNNLFRLLRESKIFTSNNEPYQSHVNAGHFRLIETTYTDVLGRKHIYKKPVVTQPGLAYLTNLVTPAS